MVQLSPEVVSSIDGTTSVRAIVLSDGAPMSDQAVSLTVAYTDRNGTAHDITGATGTTDGAGAFEATLTGLDWDGTGTVTVTVTDAPTITGDAGFSVLDRTPPKATIMAPTASMHVVQGQDFTVPVHVQDEIGVSEVWLEAAGELERARSSVVASGSADATVNFRMTVPDGARPGNTITLYALAGDLSGNLAAAAPMTLTVDARP